jgi:hypothetical protein
MFALETGIGYSADRKLPFDLTVVTINGHLK